MNAKLSANYFIENLTVRRTNDALYFLFDSHLAADCTCSDLLLRSMSAAAKAYGSYIPETFPFEAIIWRATQTDYPKLLVKLETKPDHPETFIFERE